MKKGERITIWNDNLIGKRLLRDTGSEKPHVIIVKEHRSANSFFGMRESGGGISGSLDAHTKYYLLEPDKLSQAQPL